MTTLRLTRPLETWRFDTIDNESIALAHAVKRMERTEWYRGLAALKGSLFIAPEAYEVTELFVGKPIAEAGHHAVWVDLSWDMVVRLG